MATRKKAKKSGQKAARKKEPLVDQVPERIKMPKLWSARRIRERQEYKCALYPTQFV